MLVVLSVNIIVLLIEGLLARYLWFSWNGRVTFGPLNGYIFLWVSIGIGSIAIVNSIIASLIASNSLKLTRTTQRPFLNVDGNVTCHKYPESIGRIVAGINNKGNFPADEVSAFCKVRRINKNAVNEYFPPFEKGKEYYPSYCFPGDYIQYFFEKQGIEMEREDKLEVYITIIYRNKLTDEKHKTIRAYSMTFTSSNDEEVILSPYRQGDYWD
ncbi:hypothetical protein ACFLU9_02040 [Chloroflexota bacterium]